MYQILAIISGVIGGYFLISGFAMEDNIQTITHQIYQSMHYILTVLWLTLGAILFNLEKREEKKTEEIRKWHNQ